MLLRIRGSAKADLAEIVDYLSPRSSDAAHCFIDRAFAEFELLRNNPGFGEKREDVPPELEGLRSWPIKGFGKYLIFYLPGENILEIVRVLHGNRNVGRIIGRM